MQMEEGEPRADAGGGGMQVEEGGHRLMQMEEGGTMG